MLTILARPARPARAVTTTMALLGDQTSDGLLIPDYMLTGDQTSDGLLYAILALTGDQVSDGGLTFAWTPAAYGPNVWAEWDMQLGGTNANVPDQTGNGRALIQGTPGARGTVSESAINGHRGIVFTGGASPTQFLSGSFTTLAADIVTFMAVGTLTNTSGAYARLFSASSSDETSDENNPKGVAIQRQGSNQAVQIQRNSKTAATGITYGAPFHLVAQVKAGELIRLRINGGPWVSGEAAAGASSIESWAVWFNVGGAWGAGRVIVNDIPDADLDRFIGYDGHKWGLTGGYPADFAYKSQPPLLELTPAQVAVPVAEFTAAPIGGPAPLTVTFANATTGPVDSYSLDYGDGSPPSANPNGTKVYTTAGAYSPALTANNSAGSSTKTKPGYIVVAARPSVTTTLAAIVSGKPTPGDTANDGPNPKFKWIVNGVQVGEPIEITAVTGISTQRFTYDYAGPLSDLTSIGVEYLNFAAGPREMSVSSFEIDGVLSAIDSATARTIYNPPGADLVDVGNGLLWRAGNLIKVGPPWDASPPPPPPPPSVGPAEDLSGTASVYLDPQGGNDANSGTSPATAVKTHGRAATLMAAAPAKILAQKSGSILDVGTAVWAVSGWSNGKWGIYGGTERARIKSTKAFTGAQIEFVRAGVWRVNLGTFATGSNLTGLSTSYAGARVSHALGVIVNDAHFCYWFAQWGESEINASRPFMYWHNGGYCYFGSPVAPVTVEIPFDTIMHFGGSTNFDIQDIDFCGARSHGLVVQSGCEYLNIKRCRFRRVGITGLYIQPKSNIQTYGINVLDCEFEDCHSEGLTFTWVQGGVKVCYRDCKVLRCTARNCCKGPPVIKTSNSSSQDFFSAAFKFFTDNWSGGDGWGNDIEVAYCDLDRTGDLDVPYSFGTGGYYYNSVNGYNSNQAYSIWIDTVVGTDAHHMRVHHNIIRNDWSGGVYIEYSKPGRHHIYENIVINGGLRYNGYAGCIGSGRGTTGALFYKNTLYCPSALSWSAMFLQAGNKADEATSGNEFRDNLCLVNSSVAAIHDSSRAAPGTNVFRNNLIYVIGGGTPLFRYHGGSNVVFPERFQAPYAKYGLQAFSAARGAGVTGTVTGNPMLTDPAGEDFTLLLGSTAIGAATDGGNIGAL